jgi:hypothetical protein
MKYLLLVPHSIKIDWAALKREHLDVEIRSLGYAFISCTEGKERIKLSPGRKGNGNYTGNTKAVPQFAAGNK